MVDVQVTDEITGQIKEPCWEFSDNGIECHVSNVLLHRFALKMGGDKRSAMDLFRAFAKQVVSMFASDANYGTDTILVKECAPLDRNTGRKLAPIRYILKGTNLYIVRVPKKKADTTS